FQAEDGIRDFHVTGVQTCALPIYKDGPMSNTATETLSVVVEREIFSAGKDLARAHTTTPDRGVADEERLQACRGPPFQSSRRLRSEERRVGKECRSWWEAEQWRYK